MAEVPLEDAPVSRRDRVRAETVQEIKDAARKVLVEQGVDGLALRAVARELGMTAPAIYRYFSSREDLIENVVVDLYDELCDVMEAARDATVPARARPAAAGGQPRLPVLGDHPPRRVRPAVRQRRRGRAGARGARFAGEPGAAGRRPVRRRSAPPCWPRSISSSPSRSRPTTRSTPRLQEQLRTWCEKLPVPLPLGVTYVFLHCWIRLYGMVCMEIFGHLRFALDDAQPMFEAELRSLGERLGVGGRVPAAVPPDAARQREPPVVATSRARRAGSRGHDLRRSRPRVARPDSLTADGRDAAHC